MHDTIYREAKREELAGIKLLRDAVKADNARQGLDIWQGDYPSDALLEDDYSRGFSRIVLLDDVVVGYLALIPTDIDYGPGFYGDYNLVSFSRIMTHPDYRNRGLGRKLIEASIAETKPSYDGMAITVDGFNTKAVTLYKSYGFTLVGSMRIPEAKYELEKYVLLYGDEIVA